MSFYKNNISFWLESCFAEIQQTLSILHKEIMAQALTWQNIWFQPS